MRVQIDNLRKTYPPCVHALSGVSLDVASGECVAILGPSASGKSTLLRLIAGLEAPSRGAVWLDGRDANSLGPRERGVGFVFQDAVLYPHLTLRRSIALAADASDADRRIADVAVTFGISDVLDRRPAEVSGGQRRRAALARELLRSPALLLLDEPTSGLDPHLAADAREDLASLRRSLACTTILATHDQNEAFSFADRIAILHRGMMVQTGTPRDVLRRPADRFVASFLGSPGMRFLAGRLEGGPRFVPACGLPDLPLPGAKGPALFNVMGQNCLLGLRPASLRIGDGPWRLIVRRIEPLVEHTNVYLDLPDGNTLIAIAHGQVPAQGEVVPVGIDTARAHLFETGDNGRRLEVDLSP